MLLVKPNLTCNMNCTYCYENKWRSENHPKMEYDLEKVLKVIYEAPDGEQIALHGGEPLMMPKRDVEAILSAIYQKNGKSGIQTNGLNIDGEYMDIFSRYKTSVGVSLDGLGELNSYRCDVKTTEKIFNSILEMHQRGLNLSFIAVISKANAENDNLLSEFKQFIATLSNLRITGRINPCYDDGECSLENGRLIEVYKELAWFVFSHGWRWSPFYDMWDSLRGSEKVVCVYKECDIFCTHSARVVLGDGSITNCMRVSSKGMFVRYPSEYKTRGEILQEVEQAYGGCKGCEFWEACYGGCPSQTKDWRERTYLCPMYKAIFQVIKNIQSFNQEECKPLPLRKGEGDNGGGGKERVQGHYDGIEHIDGTIRHLDG